METDSVKKIMRQIDRSIRDWWRTSQEWVRLLWQSHRLLSFVCAVVLPWKHIWCKIMQGIDGSVIDDEPHKNRCGCRLVTSSSSGFLGVHQCSCYGNKNKNKTIVILFWWWWWWYSQHFITFNLYHVYKIHDSIRCTTLILLTVQHATMHYGSATRMAKQAKHYG